MIKIAMNQSTKAEEFFKTLSEEELLFLKKLSDRFQDDFVVFLFKQDTLTKSIAAEIASKISAQSKNNGLFDICEVLHKIYKETEGYPVASYEAMYAEIRRITQAGIDWLGKKEGEKDKDEHN